MRIAISVAAALALAGCAGMHMPGGESKASATLEPTKGNTAGGMVTFTQHGDRVHVTTALFGLKPGSQQAIHVHEKGDCNSPDGMSAGGHFNPSGKPHGPQGGEHHAGDMPNVTADASGRASTSFDLAGASVAAFEGKAVIVHRDPDDYRSQPAGNAGPRVACGVIRKS